MNKPSISDVLREARRAFVDYLGTDDPTRAQLSASRFASAVSCLSQMQAQSFGEAIEIAKLAEKFAHGILDLKVEVGPEARIAIDTLAATALREGARVRHLAKMVVSGMA